MQPRGFRRQVVPGCIRPAHDHRQAVQRRVLQAKMADEAVEGAQLAVMRKRLGTRNVIRRRASLPCDSEDLLGGNVQELGVRLDEASDQPWAGNAVDLGTFASDPLHAVLPGLKCGRYTFTAG